MNAHPRDDVAPFTIERYFDGRSRAWGIVLDRFGGLRRRFTADIDGTWDGTTLTLTEDFVFDDGAQERRIWRIVRIGDGRYGGLARDVDGEAIGMRLAGGLRWRYILLLPIGRRTWRVRMDDRMFAQPDGKLIARATMRLFGVRVGEVLMTFDKAA